MRKVDKNSPIPLYHQLKTILSEMIENEELKPLDPITPERELCFIHGISRMTVNKAITGLVTDGLIFREQGKGTFVAEKKKKHQSSALLGLTADMEQHGSIILTQTLTLEKKTTTKKIRETLSLNEEAMVFELVRLRWADGKPYALETAYIPAQLCEDLSIESLEGQSLYGVLADRYGLEMEYAAQTIEPIILNDYESGILQADKNALALLFSRRTFTKDNVPLEFTKSIYRSDLYKFEITVHR